MRLDGLRADPQMTCHLLAGEPAPDARPAAGGTLETFPSVFELALLPVKVMPPRDREGRMGGDNAKNLYLIKAPRG